MKDNLSISFKIKAVLRGKKPKTGRNFGIGGHKDKNAGNVLPDIRRKRQIFDPKEGCCSKILRKYEDLRGNKGGKTRKVLSICTEKRIKSWENCAIRKSYFKINLNC